MEFAAANSITVTLDTRAFDRPDVTVPSVWTVRRTTPAPVLADVSAAAHAAARSILADPRVRPGASIAVGVGSRGIDNIVPIVRAVIDELRAAGCEPFVVPAMGSHGGATAEGQEHVLHSYGVTPEAVGAPIRATMEVVQVGALDDGYPIYFDRNALGADAVVVVNRVKHHTDFAGEIESGICKMLAIGLGKQKGAETIHRFGADGLRNIMPEVGRRLVGLGKVVGGVAILENQYGRTAEIHPLPADGIGREPERVLLGRARELAPRLAFDAVDVLVVDEMGKNISGAGMDTHVIGRVRMPSIPETDWDGPTVRMICVMDLSEATHGNAAGIGLADVVTRRLLERVDWYSTCMNHFTSGEGGAWRNHVPIVLEDPEGCIRAAMVLTGRGRMETIKLARIRNTEYVDILEVSEPLMREAELRSDLEIIEGPHAPDFSRRLGAA